MPSAGVNMPVSFPAVFLVLPSFLETAGVLMGSREALARQSCVGVQMDRSPRCLSTGGAIQRESNAGPNGAATMME